MEIIFDWSDAFYEKKGEWRGDEEIISLEISQKEHSFAVAKVIIEAKNLPLDKKYARIGVRTANEGTRLLFSGRLTAFPIGFGSPTMELELISEPDDFRAKLTTFCDENFNRYRSVDKHTEKGDDLFFDDLFFSSKDMKNPTIFLEGNSRLFYWNMRNGELSLSDINRGRKNFDVYGEEILRGTIRVRVAREPYKIVNLRLSVSWIRHEHGAVDVIPPVAARFKEGMVNSFTDIRSALQNMTIGRNSYVILQRDWEEVTPGGSHPLLSPNFYVRQEGSAAGKKVLFRRFYFDGKLILGWRRRQKRTEIVNLKVVNPSSPHGREKNLYLRLNSIQLPKKYPLWERFVGYVRGDRVRREGSVFECRSSHLSGENFETEKWKFAEKIPDALPDDASSSFFATPRGKNAVRYAARKAVALINHSSRRIEIDFCVEAKNFIFAAVDDEITVRDAGFKNGLIRGKIIRTRLSANGNNRIMKFTLGCREADLSENFASINCAEIPIVDDNDRGNSAPVVKRIEIKNSPEEQISLLSAANAGSVSELENELKRHATKIKLSLCPLNTVRAVVREINLPDMTLGSKAP
ncbi:MAG: hypothetical protein LBO73_04870 [Holosporaceae bacterium]|jgi:hypothetical protein|nr:hypothetical protein [Holosporaceae bacterium]